MKVALVTGASGGIGSATAEKLVKDGFFVFAHYNKNKSGIDALCKRLGKLKQNLCAIQADLSNEQEIENMMDSVLKSFKHIDVVVNNADSYTSAARRARLIPAAVT